MQNWNDYRNTLLPLLENFGQHNPEAMRGLMSIHDAAAGSGHLPAKVHSLIALAVAVTTRCDGCIAVHSQHAMQNGATQEEVAEALGMAIALNAGAAMVYSARALQAFQQST